MKRTTFNTAHSNFGFGVFFLMVWFDQTDQWGNTELDADDVFFSKISTQCSLHTHKKNLFFFYSYVFFRYYIVVYRIYIFFSTAAIENVMVISVCVCVLFVHTSQWPVTRWNSWRLFRETQELECFKNIKPAGFCFGKTEVKVTVEAVF